MQHSAAALNSTFTPCCINVRATWVVHVQYWVKVLSYPSFIETDLLKHLQMYMEIQHIKEKQPDLSKASFFGISWTILQE